MDKEAPQSVSRVYNSFRKVSKREFDIYQSNLFSKLDGMAKSLQDMVDMRKAEQRQEVEANLEGMHRNLEPVQNNDDDDVGPGSPERDRGRNAFMLAALLTGFATFLITKANETINNIIRAVERWTGLDLPEFALADPQTYVPASDMENATRDIEQAIPGELPDDLEEESNSLGSRLVRMIQGIIAEPAEASTTTTPSSPSTNGERISGGLGSLSRQHESGSQGTSAIGHDSTGGTSYGTYQISSRRGSMNTFLDTLEHNDPEAAARLRASGNPDSGRNGAFANEWRALAGEGRLQTSERQYIMSTHYMPAYNALRSGPKRMVDENPALREALFSTAVQHGAGAAPQIFNRVYRDGMTPQEYISAIYARRRTQFRNSTPEERASVQERLMREEQQAISMVGTNLRNMSATNENRENRPVIRTVNIDGGTTHTNSVSTPPRQEPTRGSLAPRSNELGAARATNDRATL